jgi:predicted TPR repeat methyltransferase
VPHPAVAALVPVLKARGARHVLDLGCGVGLWHPGMILRRCPLPYP